MGEDGARLTCCSPLDHPLPADDDDDDEFWCSGAALGPLLAGLLSARGWNRVFYMLMAADFLALLVRRRSLTTPKDSACRGELTSAGVFAAFAAAGDEGAAVASPPAHVRGAVSPFGSVHHVEMWVWLEIQRHC